MKNLKSIFYSRLVFSFLLVSFISVLLSNRLEVVKADVPIPNSDVTYQTWYQVNSGSWLPFTNSQDGFPPNQTVRVRLRFFLPERQNLMTGYNITFTFLHQESDISDFQLNVLDDGGQIVSGSNISYSGISYYSSSNRLRTTVTINDFKCQTAQWAVLTFVYNSHAQSVQGGGNNYIQVSVQSFSCIEESPNTAINQLTQSMNQGIQNLISQIQTSNQQIVNAVNSEKTTLLDGIVDLGSDILGGLGDLGSDLLDGIGDGIDSINGFFDDLEEGILGGLNDAINSINGFFDDLESALLGGLSALGEFVIDGIYDLFVPSSDDLQDWIEGLQTDLEEECPIIGSIMSVFTSLVDVVIDGTQVTSYHIPEVVLNFGQDSITLGNWDVPLLPDGFDDYIDYVRLFTSIIVGIAFAFMMYHRILNMIGIETKEEVEHDLDWYIREAAAQTIDSRASDRFWEGADL